jgi:hypothetical protein
MEACGSEHHWAQHLQAAGRLSGVYGHASVAADFQADRRFVLGIAKVFSGRPAEPGWLSPSMHDFS